MPMWMKRAVVVVAVLAVALLGAPGASAGYIIQPANGQVVSATGLGFLVYLDSNESLPMVEVSTSPAVTTYGFTAGFVSLCSPTTPWTEPHKFSCQLPVTLGPGTYYWAMTYEQYSCQTVNYGFGAYQSCGYHPQLSGPYQFTVTGSTTVPTTTPTTAPTAPTTTLVGAALPHVRGRTGYSRNDPGYLPAAQQISRAAQAVYCWDPVDWIAVSGDDGTGDTIELGFVNPLLHPGEINLSPTVCDGIDSILYDRAQIVSSRVAIGVDTLAHESLHLAGVRNEAQTECYAMQWTAITAYKLGGTYTFGRSLASLLWRTYAARTPPAYYDGYRCRNGGAWDLQPRSNVWP